jgi:AcrR family transcriptional regulator
MASASSDKFPSLGDTLAPMLTSVPGRRGQILLAALEVFQEKGFEAGTMRDIARRVGVTEGALYRHFDSKEDLFAEALRVTLRGISAGFIAALSQIHASTLREDLARVLTMRNEMTGGIGSGMRITLLAEVVNRPVLLDQYHSLWESDFRDAVAGALAAIDTELGIQRRPDELSSRLRSVASLLAGITIMPSLLGTPPETVVTDTTDAVISLMGWGGAGT